MPLYAIKPTKSYRIVFGTIGPVEEEWGQDILEFTDQYWRSRGSIYDPAFPPRLKFELSNDGYPHFHIGLAFQVKTGVVKYATAIRKYLAKRPKPARYSKEKGYSCRLFAVPAKSPDHDTGLYGTALINKYLDSPTKEKSTEGKNFTINLDSNGFNAHLQVQPQQSGQAGPDSPHVL